jgi:D-xylose transport system ATP-binding protein
MVALKGVLTTAPLFLLALDRSSSKKALPEREIFGQNVNPVIDIKGVKKSFGAVAALKGVDLDFYPGEVLAIVGDNGAGKSTLIKILSGVHTIDEGSILIDGHPASIKSPRDAKRFGIETIYQDLALCDNLDIPSNVYLGREITKTVIPGFLKVFDHRAMRERTRVLLEDLHIRSIENLTSQVHHLSGGQRQSIAIAKSVCFNARVIIMDEPTAALGVTQTRQVLDLARRLSERGCCVIYISHIMRDVLEIADRIAVMKSGQLVGVRKTSETDSDELVFMMISGEGRRSRHTGVPQEQPGHGE